MPVLQLQPLADLLAVSSANAALLHAEAFSWLKHAVCKQVQVAKQCPGAALSRLPLTRDLLAYWTGSALLTLVLHMSIS